MFKLFLEMVVFIVLVGLAVFTAFMVLGGIMWFIQLVCDAVGDLM